MCMQVSGQNIQLKNNNQPQANCCNNTAYVPVAQQTQACYNPYMQPVQTAAQYPQTQVQAPTAYPQAQVQYPQGYNPPQNTVYPPYQPVPVQTPQTQNYQIPASTSGVNIQIFNPSVTTPGAQPPTYNVNAPCYPSSYYTGQVGPDGKLYPKSPINNGEKVTEKTTDTKNTENTSTSTTTETTTDKKKTEKRKIVQLTDEYIKNLENYLNSQDKNIRLSAAKEVYARLEEDESRHDDKALNALINKMLQDPSEEVRLLALTALDARIADGDDYTVGVLKNIQKTADGYGQDAIDASQVLLKMSGKQVEKEFEAKDKKETKSASSKKESKKV